LRNNIRGVLVHDWIESHSEVSMDHHLLEKRRATIEEDQT